MMDPDIKKELSDAKRELETVDRKVDAIDDNVKTILMLLTGTQYDESQGLINRFEREKMENEIELDKFDKRIDKLEKRWDRAFYILIGMGIVSGSGITAFFYTIFGKK